MSIHALIEVGGLANLFIKISYIYFEVVFLKGINLPFSFIYLFHLCHDFLQQFDCVLVVFSMLWVQNLQWSCKTCRLNAYQVSDLVELFSKYFSYCLVYQLVQCYSHICLEADVM